MAKLNSKYHLPDTQSQTPVIQYTISYDHANPFSPNSFLFTLTLLLYLKPPLYQTHIPSRLIDSNSLHHPSHTPHPPKHPSHNTIHPSPLPPHHYPYPYLLVHNLDFNMTCFFFHHLPFAFSSREFLDVVYILFFFWLMGGDDMDGMFEWGMGWDGEMGDGRRVVGGVVGGSDLTSLGRGRGGGLHLFRVHVFRCECGYGVVCIW